MKVVVAGTAAVFTSAVKLEDLKRVMKYRPEALILKDEEGEEIFCVKAAETAAIGKRGIFFNAETRDEGKYATLTIPGIPTDTEDVKSYIADLYGTAIARMNKLEAMLPAVLGEIAAEDAAVKENITVL